MGILGFTLVTACNHQASQNISSSPELATAECRIAKHTMGETSVAVNPQRVVTLSLSNLGNVLAHSFANPATIPLMKKVSRAIIIFILASLTTFLFSACNQKLTKNARNLNELSRPVNCRIIQHLVGETCVPQNPQRIIALHIATLGNLVALDVKPVGSATGYQKSDFPKYFEGKIDGIQSVGDVRGCLKSPLAGIKSIRSL